MDYHAHNAAIERVGAEAIKAHFQITRQALHYWRKKGVPKRHRKTLALLGHAAGYDMPEMRETIEREREQAA